MLNSKAEAGRLEQRTAIIDRLDAALWGDRWRKVCARLTRPRAASAL
jgi:hypothetical protein